MRFAFSSFWHKTLDFRLRLPDAQTISRLVHATLWVCAEISERRFETRSLPRLLAPTLRRFTFYVVNPIRSIPSSFSNRYSLSIRTQALLPLPRQLVATPCQSFSALSSFSRAASHLLPSRSGAKAGLVFRSYALPSHQSDP